jgi:hypothetical protein
MQTKSILVVALALSTIATVLTATNVYAINDKWSTDCDGPGASGGDGDCRGQSERSGPHDEIRTNPGGNVPPGQQEDED